MKNPTHFTGLVLIFSGVLQLVNTWMQINLAGEDGGCRCQCSVPASTLGGSTQHNKVRSSMSERNYSWKKDDFPPTLDLALSSISPEFSIGDPVLLIMEDSRHYSLGSSKHGSGTKADSDRELEIDAEWESLYPGESAGFVRLGPEKRFFGLSMYHQLHCLDSLRYAIQGREHVAKRSLMSGNNQSETEKGHDDGVYGVSSDDEYRGQEQKKMGQGTKRSQVHVSHAAHCLNYLRQTILCASDLTLEPELVLGSLDVGSGLGAMHICRDWSRVHDFVEQNSRDYKKHVDEENRHGGKGGGNRDL